MGASEKLLLLLSPAEKSAIARRASASKVSMGEWVRRAVSEYRPELVPGEKEEAALQRLTAELRASTKRAARAITQAEYDINEALGTVRRARTEMSKRSKGGVK